MKRHVGFIFLFFFALFAQENDLSLIKNAQLDLLVNDVIIANKEINKIINEYNLLIEKGDVNNTKKICEYSLYVKYDLLDEIVSRIEQIGIIELKKIDSINYITLISNNDFDLKYLLEQKEFYHNELSLIDKKNDSYKDFFNKERDIDKQIYEKTKEKVNYEKNVSFSKIQLRVYEKTIQDLDSKDDFINFINMPGFESKYFRLEQQDQNEINNEYLGGSLRYMFTKGRSYFSIGIMKPLDINNNKSINDIVIYSIGKDFYPRYLGQGKNTFFNPFSGFEIGGMVLTSDESIKHMFTLEPHIGIELFKNKYFIIDTRVSYLFPLDQKKIKTLRGLTHNLSINFVF